VSEAALRSRWKAVPQLVRLPNVFTAAADSLAGWIVGGGGPVDPVRWWPLPLASMAIYAAGMALNDLCDLEVDRRERPGRPLPSGELSPRMAGLLVLSLFTAALALVGATGSFRTFATAACLIACVVGYDTFLRRTVLGPATMGACRGLNLALGLSVAPRFGGPPGWLAAGAFALFVAGITCVSLSEVEGGPSRLLRIGRVAQILALAGLFLASLAFFKAEGGSLALAGTVAAAFLLCRTAWVVDRAGARAWSEPTPARIQSAVRAGIFSLVWIDTALAAAATGPWAFVVAACWFPAYVTGKWLYST
jgi:4-hydroxybenzoate polyprenyltransferase